MNKTETEEYIRREIRIRGISGGSVRAGGSVDIKNPFLKVLFSDAEPERTYLAQLRKQSSE